MWYRSGTQLVPFDTFMQGFSGIDARAQRPISRVGTGEWAHFGPRTIATRSLKNAGIRVAQVTAGTRCYTSGHVVRGKARGLVAQWRTPSQLERRPGGAGAAAAQGWLQPRERLGTRHREAAVDEEQPLDGLDARLVAVEQDHQPPPPRRIPRAPGALHRAAALLRSQTGGYGEGGEVTKGPCPTLGTESAG